MLSVLILTRLLKLTLFGFCNIVVMIGKKCLPCCETTLSYPRKKGLSGYSLFIDYLLRIYNRIMIFVVFAEFLNPLNIFSLNVLQLRKFRIFLVLNFLISCLTMMLCVDTLMVLKKIVIYFGFFYHVEYFGLFGHLGMGRNFRERAGFLPSL